MLFKKIKRKLFATAFTVLLLQTIGLFYCGDTYCLSGENDEIVKTPPCCVPDTHDHSQQPSESNQDDCSQCACCLSYSIPDINAFPYIFIVPYFFIEPESLISMPVSRIDHIPRS